MFEFKPGQPHGKLAIINYKILNLFITELVVSSSGRDHEFRTSTDLLFIKD